MKKFLSLFIALVLMFSAVVPAAEGLITSYAETYEVIKDGLVSYYDGVNNTPNGHDSNSTVWYDIAGNNHIDVEHTADNYFTENAFHLKSAQYNFPSALLDLVNSSEFTVELTLGDLNKIGSTFATFINNAGNDNFSLFWRVSGDYIEFKAGNNSRPKVTGGFDYFENSTVTITFKQGGLICMYVDGQLIGQTTASSKIGATGDFYFGHKDSSKSHEAEYRSIRFYNRALSQNEVINNSRADGTFDESYVPDPEFAKVQQPETNIIGDICLSTYITSKDALSTVIASEKKPANLIFYTNNKLELTDKNGSAFSTVSEMFDLIDGKFIPTFYVSNVDTAKAVVDYLEDKKIIDAYIMSNIPSVVKTAREEYDYIRGIIDYTDGFEGGSATKEQLIEIRKTTISNLCHVAVIPESVATQENVKYLNSRQITTWVGAEKDVNELSALTMLISGAYGIVSNDPAAILDSAEKNLESNSLTRTPLIIGHRGIPGKMPENTLEGAIEAYNLGADVVEIDLYITVDGVIVINHDATTSKYNKTYNVESCTYAKLQELYYEHNGTEYKMPTLEDFLKEFKGKDLMLFLEIKSSKAKVVSEMKRLVEKYEMYDQCAVITFAATNQLDRLKNEYPEMPVGYLESTSYSGDVVFPSIQKKIMEYNTTYNPSYSGFNAKYVRYAVMRGVTTWPWTINETAQIVANIKNGHSGITTDNCNVTGSMVENLSLDIDVSKAFVGETIELKANKTTYNHKNENASAKYMVYFNGAVLDVEGTIVTLSQAGEYTVVAVLNDKISSLSYNVYSSPVTFTVTEKNTDAEQTTTESEASTEITTETSVPATEVIDNSVEPGIVIYIVIAAVALVVISVVVIVIVKKKLKK